MKDIQILLNAAKDAAEYMNSLYAQSLKAKATLEIAIEDVEKRLEAEEAALRT